MTTITGTPTQPTSKAEEQNAHWDHDHQDDQNHSGPPHLDEYDHLDDNHIITMTNAPRPQR